MSSYYSQFDKGDIDSWIGKDYVAEDEIDEVMENEPQEEDENRNGDDFDSLGMSWKDFM